MPAVTGLSGPRQRCVLAWMDQNLEARKAWVVCDRMFVFPLFQRDRVR